MRSATRLAVLAATMTVTGAGCIGSQTTPCGSQVCPSGFDCATVAERGVCIQSWQAKACAGRPDGEICDREAEGAVGYHCLDGVCLAGTCGDGFLDPGRGEACDDGVLNSASTPDACRPNCATSACGDGVVDPARSEVCDDGNLRSGDGCDSTCRSNEICGNGIVDLHMGEACDDGNTTAGDNCSPRCQPEICGNGTLDASEQCDDGNLAAGDGCDQACRIEGCGNGVVDSGAGEECDDGNTSPNDGCSANCTLEFCGNGITEANEVCDDGNNLPGDGCSSSCQSREECGNGIIDLATDEQCDDGPSNSDAPGGRCRTDCTPLRCGDGIVDAAFFEACDDGNLRSRDGCSSRCTVETLSWVALSPANNPGGRAGHALAYDPLRRRVVLFGGWADYGSATEARNDTWEFDGTNWLQISTANTPTARAGAGMIFHPGRGTLVLYGGSPLDGQLWEYDGTNWSSLSPAPPTDFIYPGLTYDLARDRIVLRGGYTMAWNAGSNLVYEFDGTGWSAGASDTVARVAFGFVYFPPHAVSYLISGFDYTNYATPDVMRGYDSAWNDVGTGAGAREFFATAYAPRWRAIAVFAGSITTDLMVYDGTGWSTPGVSGPSLPREGAAMAPTRTGELLLYGGTSQGTPDDGACDVGATDCLSDTWMLRYGEGDTHENCSNASDDDGDLLVDCDDPDCNGSSACPSDEWCDNGLDDDGDGLIDCRDPNCGGYRCGPAQFCVAGHCR